MRLLMFPEDPDPRQEKPGDSGQSGREDDEEFRLNARMHDFGPVDLVQSEHISLNIRDLGLR